MASKLAAFVPAQIRAEMGRQDINATRLAQMLGESDTWVGRRIKGRYAITLDDLDRIAAALDVPVHTFMPVPERVS